MKKHIFLVATVMFLLGFASVTWAQCPQDTVDSGICDTLYVTYHRNPENPIPPTEVYFTLEITHDLPDPALDSISAFAIPLKLTHTNPAAYCSIPSWRNKTAFYPDSANSIFRHFQGLENRMMSLYQQGSGAEWDIRYLDVHYDTSGAGYFWLSLVPLGATDRQWWEGSRTLLATMTLLVEDTMTICIDTCFWPPSVHLAFAREGDAKSYVPRHFMPVCKWVGPGPPPAVSCPVDEFRHTNGTFQTGPFSAWSEEGEITSVYVNFEGTGITDVEVIYTQPPPAPYVEGYVVYTVTDYCSAGGSISILVFNDIGLSDECWVSVFLTNNAPPNLNLPDTVTALTRHTLQLNVSASDPNPDSVTIGLDAFWYEPDSLRSPTDPPSYSGGNPGIFNWTPAEAETGTWISSFSATNTCDGVDKHKVTILVEVPYWGDCNRDDWVNSADVVYLINYLFGHGPAPDPLEVGDTNCDVVVDVSDVIYLINYLFKNGPTPSC